MPEDASPDVVAERQAPRPGDGRQGARRRRLCRGRDIPTPRRPTRWRPAGPAADRRILPDICSSPGQNLPVGGVVGPCARLPGSTSLRWWNAPLRAPGPTVVQTNARPSCRTIPSSSCGCRAPERIPPPHPGRSGRLCDAGTRTFARRQRQAAATWAGPTRPVRARVRTGPEPCAPATSGHRYRVGVHLIQLVDRRQKA